MSSAEPVVDKLGTSEASPWPLSCRSAGGGGEGSPRTAGGGLLEARSLSPAWRGETGPGDTGAARRVPEQLSGYRSSSAGTGAARHGLG